MPDLVFHRLDEQAARIGLSRSAFLVHAAERYMDELDRDGDIDRINAAVLLSAQDERAAAELALSIAYGRRALAESSAEDDW
jgi:hypothetical protein